MSLCTGKMGMDDVVLLVGIEMEMSPIVHVVVLPVDVDDMSVVSVVESGSAADAAVVTDGAEVTGSSTAVGASVDRAIWVGTAVGILAAKSSVPKVGAKVASVLEGLKVGVPVTRYALLDGKCVG